MAGAWRIAAIDLRDERRTGAADVDDVAFLGALVDRAVRDHRLDRSRVYVTGASNGIGAGAGVTTASTLAA